MNRSKQRRRDRRRAKNEVFFAKQDRRMPMPRTMAHNMTVDAVHADMDRSPRRARLWVWLGAALFVFTVASMVADCVMQ